MDQITRVGLDYGILTQYTSFVAVQAKVVNVGGKQRTVHVPVESAQGVVTFDAGDPRGVQNVVNQLGLLLGGGRSGNTSLPTGAQMGGGGGFGGGGIGGAGGSPPSAPRMREPVGVAKKSADPKAKISLKLAGLKGKLEVQVQLKELTPDLIAQLEKLGLTVDDKDEKIKVLFGTCDADVLEKIAEVEAVRRIDPLE